MLAWTQCRDIPRQVLWPIFSEVGLSPRGNTHNFQARRKSDRTAIQASAGSQRAIWGASTGAHPLVARFASRCRQRHFRRVGKVNRIRDT